MRYDIELDNEGVVINYRDLPDLRIGDSMTGIVMLFRIDQDPSRVFNTMMTDAPEAHPCHECVFNDSVFNNRDICPWDPETGDYVCQIYGHHRFINPDTMLEDL